MILARESGLRGYSNLQCREINTVKVLNLKRKISLNSILKWYIGTLSIVTLTLSHLRKKLRTGKR